MKLGTYINHVKPTSYL